MARRMRGDIAVGQSGEHVIADVAPGFVVAFAERFAQTAAVGVVVNGQARVGLQAVLFAHRAEDRGLCAGDAEHIALEVALQRIERAHAARSISTDAASARACWSSADSCASGGILSSRSIIVATGPNRRSASAYSAHTGSATGWSCVSMMQPACVLWPAKWICCTRRAGSARRYACGSKP